MTSPTPTIHLRFINNTAGPQTPSVVFFAKNATAPNGLAVAWKVVSNPGIGSTVAFDYPQQSYVGASDSFGAATPLVPAQNGEAFSITAPDPGLQLQANGSATSPAEIVVSNAAARPMNVSVYKDNRLLFLKTDVLMGQSAVFVNTLDLYMACMPGVQEGEIMETTSLTEFAQISLIGLRSADVVLSGGGTGAHTKPYKFELQNVAFA